MLRRIGGYLYPRKEPAPRQSRLLEREGYERLRASCISGALIREGIPYDAGVDMKFAELVIDEDPDTL